MGSLASGRIITHIRWVPWQLWELLLTFDGFPALASGGRIVGGGEVEGGSSLAAHSRTSGRLSCQKLYNIYNFYYVYEKKFKKVIKIVLYILYIIYKWKYSGYLYC